MDYNAVFSFLDSREGHNYWSTNFLIDDSLPKVSAIDDLINFLNKIIII